LDNMWANGIYFFEINVKSIIIVVRVDSQ
jgi:hypothetical protein